MAVRDGQPKPRHNLPAALTSFIGRDRELSELCETLHATRLLTLSGPGGVGKTRLALELVHGVLGRDATEYPDGVWLVELASLADPSLVADTVAAALLVAEVPSQPMLDTLVRTLSSQRSLLLLDNCEHLTFACGNVLTRASELIVSRINRPVVRDESAVWTSPPG